MQQFLAVEHPTMLYNMKEEKHETHKLRPPFWRFCYPHPSPKRRFDFRSGEEWGTFWCLLSLSEAYF